MGDIQEVVAGIVDERIASGAERAVQVCAHVDGQPVVDVAIGPSVDPGTLFYNWSIGKGATATLVHRQVDAGRIGYDTPVADVWPEFAQHGKGVATVRQVLDHSAGLPGLPAGVTVDDVCDWDTMTAALAGATPWWEPGTKVGYHAYTFGYLCGEIVRRVTGRPLGAALDELTADLGLPGEICFGMPAAEWSRLAELVDGPELADFPPPDLDLDQPMFRAVPPAVFPNAALSRDPRVLAADIPAGAKVTARALARLYADWLGSDRLDAACAESSSGVDQVYGNDSRWGLGFALGLPFEGVDAPRAFGMAGAGGSWAGADPDRGVAVAVTKSLMGMDFETVRRVVGAVLTEVGR
jgi:CubicO group peptidase (beta-lactamase class C family)